MAPSRLDLTPVIQIAATAAAGHTSEMSLCSIRVARPATMAIANTEAKVALRENPLNNRRYLIRPLSEMTAGRPSASTYVMAHQTALSG